MPGVFNPLVGNMLREKSLTRRGFRGDARPASFGSRASSNRAHLGSDKLCRTGTRGSTRSTRCAAVSCIRRVVQHSQLVEMSHRQ